MAPDLYTFASHSFCGQLALPWLQQCPARHLGWHASFATLFAHIFAVQHQRARLLLTALQQTSIAV